MIKEKTLAHFQYPELIKIAIYLSVITATTVLSIKTYGWIMTDSVSLFGSLLDSMLDISSSLINMVAIRIALLPPDDNHRFGHDKIQDLAIFSQSILFFGSSIFTLFSAIKRLFYLHEVGNHELGIQAMILCTTLTLLLVCFQNYVYKKTKSSIVAVDKFHNFVDLLTNLSVIVSIKISTICWYIDSVFGILIGLYLLYGAINLLKKALKNLIDHEFDKSEKQKILDIISKHKEILGVHELKTRYAGSKPFIQCHLEMNGDMTLSEAHRVSDIIQNEIEDVFPGCEILIHQDPAGYEENIMYPEKI